MMSALGSFVEVVPLRLAVVQPVLVQSQPVNRVGRVGAEKMNLLVHHKLRLRVLLAGAHVSELAFL